MPPESDMTDVPEVQSFIRKMLMKVAVIFITAFIGQLIVMGGGALLWGINMNTKINSFETRMKAQEDRAVEDRVAVVAFKAEFGRLNDNVNQMIGKMDGFLKNGSGGK